MDGRRYAVSELTVSSSLGSYTIDIALGAAALAGEAAVALVDPVVGDRITFPRERMILIEGNESSKTLTACERVLVEMKNSGLSRGELIVAVGGGVIQDVATLTSSLYMRGVGWVYVPTTLMAMADSCIGGKSSINAGGVKNLVGNFHPPQRVLVDPEFVETLSEEAIVSGLAEAVKICFARSAESFETFLSMPASILPGPDSATAELIEHVLSAKKWFVEIDELDKAERQLLNFGHSFGHAWESSCGYAVQHGVAVAAGVLAAIRHPRAAHTPLTERLADYCTALLVRVEPQVRNALAATKWDLFRNSLASDKKNGRETLRLVLPVSGESVGIVDLPMNNDQLTIAQDALRRSLKDVCP
jgi:3-dehydroquinate synthase